jgi:hypothetical protein
MKMAKRMVLNYLSIVIGVSGLPFWFLTILYYPPMYSLGVGSAQRLSITSFLNAAYTILYFIKRRLPLAILFFGLFGAMKICVHKKKPLAVLMAFGHFRRDGSASPENIHFRSVQMA